MSGKHYYTDEKNAQIVIALLKAHGVDDHYLNFIAFSKTQKRRKNEHR